MKTTTHTWWTLTNKHYKRFDGAVYLYLKSVQIETRLFKLRFVNFTENKELQENEAIAVESNGNIKRCPISRLQYLTYPLKPAV